MSENNYGFFQIDRETFYANLANHPTRHLLFNHLMAMADYRTGVVTESMLSVAKKAGLTRKQVRVALHYLGQQNIVTVLPEKRRDKKTRIIINTYFKWAKQNDVGQQKGQQNIGVNMQNDDHNRNRQNDVGQQKGQQTECSYLEEKILKKELICAGSAIADFWQCYSDGLFETIGVRPERDGKTMGQAKYVVEQYGIEHAMNMLLVWFAMPIDQARKADYSLGMFVKMRDKIARMAHANDIALNSSCADLDDLQLFDGYEH